MKLVTGADRHHNSHISQDVAGSDVFLFSTDLANKKPKTDFKNVFFTTRDLVEEKFG